MKAKSFDGSAILVDMRNDVDVIAGTLRGARHGHTMGHKIPVLGHEIDRVGGCMEEDRASMGV